MLRGGGRSVSGCLGGAGICVAHVYGDYGGNGVLEDQLFLVIGFQDERVLVETLDAAGKFHAAEQVKGNDSLIFARIVQKAVLYVLRWFVHRVPQFTREKGPVRAHRLTIVHQKPGWKTDWVVLGEPDAPATHAITRSHGRIGPPKRPSNAGQSSLSSKISDPILSWHLTQNLAQGTASRRLGEIGSSKAAQT